MSLAVFTSLFVFSWAALSGSIPILPAENPRYAALRHEIKRHQHFNLHCWCSTIYVTDVQKSIPVTAPDIPVLIGLLADRDSNARIGGRALLESIGEPALPALRGAIYESDKTVVQLACEAAHNIEREDNRRSGRRDLLEVETEPVLGATLSGAQPCSAYALVDHFATSRTLAFSIIFRSVEFGVETDRAQRIERITTRDRTFESPEGVRVGSTSELVTSRGGSPPVLVPNWAYYSELPSGWFVAFQAFGRQARLDSTSRVGWFFKFADPPERWLQK